MRSVTKRATASLVWGCVLFGLLIAGVGTAGIIGVESTNRAAAAITDDELATVNATSDLRRAVDTAFSDGLELALSPDAADRTRRSGTLYNTAVPGVETDLATVIRLHAGDDPTELTGIRHLAGQWAAVRLVVNRGLSTPARADELRRTFTPLSDHLDQLIEREATDAQDGKSRAAAAALRTRLVIGTTVLVSVLAAVGIGLVGRRHIRHAIEPEQ
jgi:hypothetical protein